MPLAGRLCDRFGATVLATFGTAIYVVVLFPSFMFPAYSIPVLVLASWLLDSGQWQMVVTADRLSWASVAYSALVASIVGHGLFFVLVQRHPVSAIMPYLLLTPLLAVIFGVLLWGDRPGPRLLLGGALVLAGILVVTLRARQKALQGR
jgi:O-acetylserine/cysteine efflux transporter